jgi:hypothetical protein
MLSQMSKQIRERYRHADECREKADSVQSTEARADFLFLEERWRSLAHSYEFCERRNRFTAPQPSAQKIRS